MTLTRESTVVFTAADGTELVGGWYEPDESPRGAVLIVPAMATPATYYGPFASWLRERGFAVLTFDYRGFGASLEGSMRDVDADVMHWAGDARDALTHLADWAEGLPVTWIGHSLGGQLVPFAEYDRLSKIITVAAGSGYWRLLPRRIRHGYALLGKVLVPISTALWGYYPGGRLRLMGDVPAGVMRRWTRWCFHPDYVVGAEGAHARFAKMPTPIAAFSFTDDEFMTDRCIAALHRWFTNSSVVSMRYTPDQLGVSGMGHFGFFRERRAALWDELVLPHLPTG